MRIVELAKLDKAERDRLMARSGTEDERVKRAVEKIIAAVKARGDAALREFTERFDWVKIGKIDVGEDEIEQAYSKTGKKILAALKLAKANI